jgi:hypothetical protein
LHPSSWSAPVRVIRNAAHCSAQTSTISNKLAVRRLAPAPAASVEEEDGRRRRIVALTDRGQHGPVVHPPAPQVPVGPTTPRGGDDAAEPGERVGGGGAGFGGSGIDGRAAAFAGNGSHIPSAGQRMSM